MKWKNIKIKIGNDVTVIKFSYRFCNINRNVRWKEIMEKPIICTSYVRYVQMCVGREKEKNATPVECYYKLWQESLYICLIENSLASLGLSGIVSYKTFWKICFLRVQTISCIVCFLVGSTKLMGINIARRTRIKKCLNCLYLEILMFSCV